jgi:hypothetical protein
MRDEAMARAGATSVGQSAISLKRGAWNAR